MTKSIKVSVIMPTYNHAKFIQQAILSAVNQKTTFHYEILVGEDDSSDRTREIVKQLAAKYPDLIRPFYNSRKDVIYINGRATGRWNFINLMKQARGEHIAMLEGDDYWINDYKLQKQVDYLDSHPNCSIVFHNVRLDTMASISASEVQHPPNFRNKSSLEDLLKKNFIATCSVLYRSNYIHTLPKWFLTAPTGDWPLHIVNAKQGSIDYIPDVMGVYRQHENGFWNSIKNQSITTHLYNLQFYELIKSEVPDHLITIWKKLLCKTYYGIIKELYIEGNIQQAAFYIRDHKQYCRRKGLDFSDRITIQFWILAEKINLLNIYKRIRNSAIHKIRHYWWCQYTHPDTKDKN